MPYTVDSTLGDILQEKPEARPIITKYGGGILLIQPTARDMTIEKALAHPLRWDQERINAFLAELNAL